MVTISEELGSRLGTAPGSHAAQGGEKTPAHQNQGEKPFPLAWTHSSLRLLQRGDASLITEQLKKLGFETEKL